MCRIDGAEAPEFWFDKIRCARTQHRCCECDRTIVPGEKYEYVATKWDGSMSTVKTCLQCVEARTFLVHECSGYVVGEVLEEIREHWDEGIKNLPMGRLIVAMGNQWLKKKGGARFDPEMVAALVTGATT